MFKTLSKSARHFAIAVFLLLLIVLLAEVGLRVTAPPRAATVTAVSPCHLQGLLVPSATTHHEMVRMASITCDSGIEITTNSLGLRGPQPDNSNASNRRRILVLGDETILGPRLGNDETVPARLEQFLNKNGVEAEVINAGVPGYSPLLSWLLFQHELERLKPDVVILHFDMTDVADDASYRPHLKSEGDQRVCCNALLHTGPQNANPMLRLVQSSALVDWLRQKSGLGGGASEDDRNWLQDRYRWTAASSSDLRLLVEHALDPIRLFHRASRDQGFELILSTSPVPWQVVRNSDFPVLADAIAINDAWPVTQDLPQRILGLMSEKNVIPFCDATPAFRKFSQPAQLFELNDRNLSRFGAALYARELAGQILSLKFAESRRQGSTVH